MSAFSRKTAENVKNGIIIYNFTINFGFTFIRIEIQLISKFLDRFFYFQLNNSNSCNITPLS